jgi:hypothetical protein
MPERTGSSVSALLEKGNLDCSWYGKFADVSRQGVKEVAHLCQSHKSRRSHSAVFQAVGVV